ncbi:putative NIT2-nitrilase [Meredithblackwellia eburnea MCA 4105]
MVLAAVGQLCSKAVVETNLRLCASIVTRAAQQGARLVWLPEASDFIADAKHVPELSRPLNESPFIDGLKQAAKQSNVWVGVGVHESGPPEDSKRCYNTNLLISPEGMIVQAYRKVHLFDVDIAGGATILESNTTIPGKEFLDPVETPVGKVGLLTCYDIRFPEANLVLRRKGAQVITYPSAFTMKTGAAHWNVLLRARAIESQSYILAPAQVGQHSATRVSFGNAMIIDPWGTVVAQTTDQLPAGDEEDAGTFVLADINLPWVEKIRTEMPLWEQRRTDVYPAL